jgi:peroxiredoxin
MNAMLQKRNIRKWVAGFVLLSITCGGIVLVKNIIAPSRNSAVIDHQLRKNRRTFPQYRLQDTKEVLHASNDVENRVRLYVFLSPWDCPNCLRESMYWQLLAKKHGAVKVFAVSKGIHRKQLGTLIDTYHLTFPILLDHENQLFDSLGIEYTPLKILVDQQGIIRKIDNNFYESESDFLASIGIHNEHSAYDQEW